MNVSFETSAHAPQPKASSHRLNGMYSTHRMKYRSPDWHKSESKRARSERSGSGIAHTSSGS